MKRIKKDRQTDRIAVIGLGYVGMAMAIEFNKYFENVIGYDLENVIQDIDSGKLSVDTVSKAEFDNADIVYTSNIDDLVDSTAIFIAVPTPINENNKANLSSVLFVTVGLVEVIKKSKTLPIICYESTMAPGTTEDICDKIFEGSGLIRNTDYVLAYSPERINPGDAEHSIYNTVKIVASDNSYGREKISSIYDTIMDHRNGGDVICTDSIRAAEASKMFENCQRDVMIALSNEMAIDFDKLHIDTSEVFRLAQTRWNFMPYFPGLVGGHCIPVDPYYMIEDGVNKKYSTMMLESSRAVNESVPIYLANKVNNLISSYFNGNRDVKIGVLGLAFKPNTNDIRNTKIINMILELAQLGHYHDFIYSDINVDNNLFKSVFGIELSNINELKNLDVLIISTKHKEYIKTVDKYYKMLKPDSGIIIDIHGTCLGDNTNPNILYWRYGA